MKEIKMFNLKYVIFLSSFVVGITSLEHTSTDDSLVMVHALFRHGERTTENFYPTDPHINETFFPIGKGGLTNRGKLQEYQLGEFLRQRYDKFLGDVYSDKIMHVRSTGFIRTRMSALLVAAGLWPPSELQLWNDQLSWLPIPVDYKPYEEEDLLNPGACPKRLETLKKQYLDEKVKEIYITPYQDLMNYVEKNSGKPIKHLQHLSEFYLILKTEEDTHYTLPQWTKTIYPEPLYSAVSRVYNYFNYNPELKKINAGYFFKKVLNDFHLKINGSTAIPKIFLYGAHESTLGHILDALKVEPHVPEYSSVVLLELHKNKKDEYFIKILYKRKTYATHLEYISYPGCETNCTVYQFQDLITNILPTVDYKEACQSK